MKRQLLSSLVILLIIIAGFRIINLSADPPADFSWSGGYFADEGFWSHNARNAVLFGQPVQDEWDARTVSPLFARVQGWIFRAFGAGLLQVRLVAVFSSLLLAAGAFALFRTIFDPQRSFLFGVLVSLNYPMMVLGRQGILDPFAACLCLLALLLLMRNTSPAALFAGVLFVASCSTKYLMIYALVPCLYLAWFSKRYVPFLAGILITALIWYFANYLPHRELLEAYNAYYASQQSWTFSAILKNIVTQPFYLYFFKTPAILCFANLALWSFIAIALSRSDNGRSNLNQLEKMCLVWLITGILFFAVWRYRPFRYYTSLIPPVTALAVFSLYRLNGIVESVRRKRVRFLVYAGMVLPMLQAAWVLADRWGGWGIIPAELGLHWFDVSLFLALSAALFWTVRRRRFKFAIFAFIAVLLLSDLRNFMAWMLNPQYQAVEIARDLQKRAPDGVITGQWAPELCLNNRLRVIPVWRGFVNSQDPFQRYHITHVLQWKYSLGGEKFEEWYPEDFNRFRFVTKYRIKNSDLLLFETTEKQR